jgi:hypothetical protein
LASCTCEQADLSKEGLALQKLLDQYRDYKGGLIPVLQEAQNIYGYLPKDVILQIAKELRMPASKVFGVCTFYAQFHLKPRGRNIIRSPGSRAGRDHRGPALHTGDSGLYRRLRPVTMHDGQRRHTRPPGSGKSWRHIRNLQVEEV